MKDHSVEGIIYTIDKYNIKYAVCYVKQITYTDDTYKYIFRPFYNIIDMLKPPIFQGIPGLNLDLRKVEYIRENETPTFIYERTPQENREDLWELLEEVNMKYLDKLEWLIRTDMVYTGDKLIVERYQEPMLKYNTNIINVGDNIIVESINSLGKNNYEIIKNLLKIITYGAFVKTNDFNINDENRYNLYPLIYNLFINEFKKIKSQQKKGIEKAKSNEVYKGRVKQTVSIPLLKEVIEKMENNLINEQEAMSILGIKSRSTLYRRIKEFKEND